VRPGLWRVRQYEAPILGGRRRDYQTSPTDSTRTVASRLLSVSNAPSTEKGHPTARKESRQLRSWRVAILRNRSHYLGEVQAPDEKASETVAVVEFDLSGDQRRRVVVQERD
jgi:hypothetical protein